MMKSKKMRVVSCSLAAALSLGAALSSGVSLVVGVSWPQAARANTMQSARMSARILLILFYLSSSILPGFAGVCWGLLGDAG